MLPKQHMLVWHEEPPLARTTALSDVSVFVNLTDSARRGPFHTVALTRKVTWPAHY
jgi:hypothetical protein